MPRVHIAKDGIIRIDYRAHDRITLEVVRQAFEKQRALAQGKQRPVLIFAQGVTSLAADAVEFLKDDEVKSLTKASAILTKSFVEEQLGNMYLMLNVPSFPIRFFTSESGALRWLTAYVEMPAKYRPALRLVHVNAAESG